MHELEYKRHDFKAAIYNIHHFPKQIDSLVRTIGIYRIVYLPFLFSFDPQKVKFYFFNNAGY